MHTIFDWTALVLFCGLAALCLHRSVGNPVPGDRVVNYLPAALGCAAANLLGNAGWTKTACLVLLLTLGYALLILKPWRPNPK